EIRRPDRDEIVATSLIRLLSGCGDARKRPVLAAALRDPSPLVRSAAATAFAGAVGPDVRDALLAATGDDYRLVRIRAASVLAACPLDGLPPADRARLARAAEELETSLRARPDDWSSNYNLGNLFMDRGDLGRAIAAYRKASMLRPDSILPLVNASIAYARLGDPDGAEAALRKAVAIEPGNAEARFNLGLLLAERGSPDGAETQLRAALKADPTLAAAAYNLAVLLAEKDIGEAVEWCRRAAGLRPDEPRYAYTLAFYLHHAGDDAEARRVLVDLLAVDPDSADARALLERIERSGRE
ncbi:MAG: tetratricopeptide repeat protein, partial [Planctomycetes bacterium]|nr:tetratricopeptide repeat protein [Planctomycetota bacterium]